MTREEPSARQLELARRPQAVIHAAVRDSFPTLNEAAVDDVLAAAKVLTGRALRELADHLFAHPDALLTGSSEAPLAMFRLLGHLTDVGQPVVLPRCTGCGKSTFKLNRTAPSGRICDTCAAKIKVHDCDRCGRQKVRIVARRRDGRICNACYLSDHQRAEPCSRCGQVEVPVARPENGQPVCRRCWGELQAQCSICGRHRKTPYAGSGGPVCNTCYSRTGRHRTCGHCGQVRLVARKAADGQPDLCRPCNDRRRPRHICSRCQLDRAGRRIEDGTWRCDNCIPRPHDTCTRCGRSRPVGARLPRGPVCGSCNSWIHDHPANCTSCGDFRVLLGHARTGPVCGPCAGTDRDPRCQTCSRPGRHYAGTKCSHCTLSDRLDELIANEHGEPSEQLLPLRDLLLHTENPAGTISWLRRSKNGHALRELLSNGNTPTHAQLDALPQGRHELFLRRLLVTAGVLPARNDEIERVPAWLDELLATQPEHRVALIRPFAHWSVLHRARRSSSRRRRQPTGSAIRERIRVALEFLAWIDTHNTTLAGVDQPLLDRWFATGAARRRHVRYFLSWARARRLASDLQVPPQRRSQPEHLLDDTERCELIRRTVQDASSDLDTRAAAALVLLFGLPLTRIRRLTADDLCRQSNGSYLAYGDHRLLLPPTIAALLEQLARDGGNHHSRFAASSTNTRWLFRGLTPGTPISHDGLRLKLKAFGLGARHARNGALASLATELPAAVLSDLLDLHPTTATRWTKLVARDWHTFVASQSRNTAGSE